MSSMLILPRLIQIGEHAVESIVQILEQLDCHHPVIITDEFMVDLGYVKRVENILKNANIKHGVFSETETEPSDESIERGVAFVNSNNFDCMIALGGGSVIDSAKATSIVSRFGGKVRDYKFPAAVDKAGVPLIAIPTTAGTGSEATNVTVITDKTTNEKMMCKGNGFMPQAAILDYSLTLSVPPRITADTGIDALTHAMEAYVSKKANLYSDRLALAAMSLFGKYLLRAYKQPDDKEARENMMLASHMAGSAFGNASVALVHGMSRPIGAFFHVPHGLSNAMLLPTITAYSLDGAPQRYATCAKMLGFAKEGDNDQVANEKLVAMLEEYNHDMQVPSLRKFGVAEKTFHEVKQTMAQQAIASGSPANNPKVPSQDDIVTLYDSIWAIQ